MDDLQKLLENAGVTESGTSGMPMQGEYTLEVDTDYDKVIIYKDTGHAQGPSAFAAFRLDVWKKLVGEWHNQDDQFDPYDTDDDDDYGTNAPSGFKG